MARSTGQAGLAVVEKGKELNTQYGVAEKVCSTDDTFEYPTILLFSLADFFAKLLINLPQ